MIGRTLFLVLTILTTTSFRPPADQSSDQFFHNLGTLLEPIAIGGVAYFMAKRGTTASVKSSLDNHAKTVAKEVDTKVETAKKEASAQVDTAKQELREESALNAQIAKEGYARLKQDYEDTHLMQTEYQQQVQESLKRIQQLRKAAAVRKREYTEKINELKITQESQFGAIQNLERRYNATLTERDALAQQLADEKAKSKLLEQDLRKREVEAEGYKLALETLKNATMLPTPQETQ